MRKEEKRRDNECVWVKFMMGKIDYEIMTKVK